MSDKDIVEAWDDLISRTARFVAYDFPGSSFEDLYQDLWVFVLETPELDPNRPGVGTILSRKAKMIAMNQRKHDLFLTAQYTYRTSDVREILVDIFDYESWAKGFCPADAKGDDLMGSIDVRADVTAALEKLPVQYQEIIYSRYRHNADFEPHTAERRRLNRAIKRLTDTLNSYYRGTAGHPGKRKVISNAQARAMVEDQDA